MPDILPPDEDKIAQFQPSITLDSLGMQMYVPAFIIQWDTFQEAYARIYLNVAGLI